MFNCLTLKNFKSIENIDLELGKLNVLSGINGSGKSTVCQALMLLKQYASGEKKVISLNSEPLNLGKLTDVYHQNARSSDIEIRVQKSDTVFGFKVDVEQGDLESDFSTVNAVRESNLNDECILNDLSAIRYLAAERLGPRTAQRIDHQTVRVDRHVGVQGEYTNSFLEFYGDDYLELGYRAHLEAPTDQLAVQTAHWLKNITPNINLNTKNHPETDQVSLSYNFDVMLGKSGSVRPTNIGFGISYALPVIVMCLSAKADETIIIDTPEAHLHPKGQFLMGELIACTAADGIQVIVETHSDHVLNGIRVQTVKKVLEPEHSKFYYFELGAGRQHEAPKTIYHAPTIDCLGQFDHWPKGFFDEWSYALNEMLRLRTEKNFRAEGKTDVDRDDELG